MLYVSSDSESEDLSNINPPAKDGESEDSDEGDSSSDDSSSDDESSEERRAHHPHEVSMNIQGLLTACYEVAKNLESSLQENQIRTRVAGARSFVEVLFSDDAFPFAIPNGFLDTAKQWYYSQDTILQSQQPAGLYAITVVTVAVVVLCEMDLIGEHESRCLETAIFKWLEVTVSNQKRLITGLRLSVQESFKDQFFVRHILNLPLTPHLPLGYYLNCWEGVMKGNKMKHLIKKAAAKKRIKDATPRYMTEEEQKQVENVQPETAPQAKVSKNFSVMMNYDSEFTVLCEKLFDKNMIFKSSPHKKIFLHTLLTIMGSLGCRATDFRYATLDDFTQLIVPRNDAEHQDVYIKNSLHYNKGRLHKKWTDGWAYMYPDLNNRARCPVTAIAIALTMIDEKLKITKKSEFFTLLWCSFKGKAIRLFGEEGSSKHASHLDKMFKDALSYFPEWDTSHINLYSIRKMFLTTLTGRFPNSMYGILVDVRGGHASAENIATSSNATTHYVGLSSRGKKVVGLVAANRHASALPGDPIAQYLIHQYRDELIEVAYSHFPRNVIDYLSVDKLVPFAAYLCIAKRDKHKLIDRRFAYLNDRELNFYPIPIFEADYTEAVNRGSIKPIRYSYSKQTIVSSAKIIIVQEEEDLLRTYSSSDDSVIEWNPSSSSKRRLDSEQLEDDSVSSASSVILNTDSAKKRRIVRYARENNDLEEEEEDDNEEEEEDNEEEEEEDNEEEEESEEEEEEAVPRMSEWGRLVFKPDKSEDTKEFENSLVARAVKLLGFPRGPKSKEFGVDRLIELTWEKWNKFPEEDWLPMSKWNETISQEAQKSVLDEHNNKGPFHNLIKKIYPKYRKIATYIIQFHHSDASEAGDFLAERFKTFKQIVDGDLSKIKE